MNTCQATMCQTLLGNASAAMKVTCVAFANFHVVNTPTVANSKLQCHALIVGWEETPWELS